MMNTSKKISVTYSVAINDEVVITETAEYHISEDSPIRDKSILVGSVADRIMQAIE